MHNAPWVGVNIPWIEGFIYHMLRDQITMGTGFNIPWIGIDKWLVGGQNTMCSGGQHTMGKWLVGVQNTMGRGSKYHGKGVRYTIARGFDIPWLGWSKYHVYGSIYHGEGVRYTIGTGVNILWVRVRHAMNRELYIPWIRGQNTI
jgi:hypothetical protein